MIATNSMIAEAVVAKLNSEYNITRFSSETIMLNDIDIWRSSEEEDLEISFSDYCDLVDSIALHYACVYEQEGVYNEKKDDCF